MSPEDRAAVSNRRPPRDYTYTADDYPNQVECRDCPAVLDFPDDILCYDCRNAQQEWEDERYEAAEDRRLRNA